MKYVISTILLLTAGAYGLFVKFRQGSSTASIPYTRLHLGDLAPNFVGVDQDGHSIQLSDFKGKNLILYFYPKDNTPFCTLQARSLRDRYTELQMAGYEVVGVSSDTQESHKKFIAKHALPFRLLADVNHTIQEQYGTTVQKNFLHKTYVSSMRITFVIDEEGRISKIIRNVKTTDHATQILADISPQ